jgi:hypothetical protein
VEEASPEIAVISAAIAAVKSGKMSIRQTANKHGINYSKLFRVLSGAQKVCAKVGAQSGSDLCYLNAVSQFEGMGVKEGVQVLQSMLTLKCVYCLVNTPVGPSLRYPWGTP